MDKVERDQLALRVYRLVREYAQHKTERRCDIKWESFKDKKNDKGYVDVPQKYREAREKVCADAFLSVRSRKAREDFAAYFTGTLCSIPQFLKEDDYRLLSEALVTEQWEDVRNLTMLALSAMSRV